MKVEAIKKHRYAGKTVEIGETYDCKERNVKILVATGRISKPARRRTYKRRDMQVEENG